MAELVDPYVRTRDRMCAVVADAAPDDLTRTVPACPAWSAADLVAHVVSMPAALAAGRRPDGDIGAWLQELVVDRRGQPVDAMIDEWRALEDAIATMLDGPGTRLFADLAVHEHDLRGALDRPDHGALEVETIVPRTLAAFAGPFREAGLGAIAVRHDGRTWASHDAEPGWTLLVEPWEAVRAVNSRRTADELRALPADGDATPFIPLLDAHLSLPTRSLGELA